MTAPCGDGRAAMLAFAHRGGRAHGPDNTLTAFREALARGATGLETDAWLTSDGVVVLDHDGVHRAARRRRVPLAQVGRDDLPGHIPTLAELYAACGTGFDLAVDVHSAEVGVAVLDAARSVGAVSRLWLVAPQWRMLPTWRSLDEQVRLAVTIPVPERRRSVLRAARAAGAEAVNLRALWWTRAFVRHAHDVGLLAFAYDAQTVWSLRRAVAQGCDGVFSDHVTRMAAAVGRAAEHGGAPR